MTRKANMENLTTAQHKEFDGPAFPAPAGVSHITEQGMTLRDYFAAKALQGMMSRTGSHDADIIAHDAYMVADAMLEKRRS